ncbi:MAG: DNA-processing protein DprA [Gemmatimonadota bacterium]
MAAVAPGCRSDPRPFDDEALAALGLSSIPGLGPRRFRLLVERHGSARAALAALRAGETDVPLPRGLRVRGRTARSAEQSVVARSLPEGARVVSFGMPVYPAELGRLDDPPPVLWLHGPLAPGSGRAVCVIGTRRATEYGRRMARRLAAGLAEAGWRVVSGLARGVDAEAHRGALEAGGETVGVPGCGLGHFYPASSRALYGALSRRGLLLTEFPPGERPAPAYFPRRNRILAGLARAVVVVQAGARSGALITARQALDIGVDVLAVPGRADLEASEGVHALLRDGAGVVTRVSDVLDALGDVRPHPQADAPVHLAAAGDAGPGRILRRLRGGPTHVDVLAREAALAIPETLALLGRLEAEGAVRGLPGGRYEAAR